MELIGNSRRVWQVVAPAKDVTLKEGGEPSG